MTAFDVAPFALPGTAPNEVRFERPRDVCRVVARFAGPAPDAVGLSYLRKTWPHTRHELPPGMGKTNPCQFGWRPIDDWFNATWQPAAIQTRRQDERTVEITFAGLQAELSEYPERERYNVAFRRTLGIRVETTGGAPPVERLEVYTESQPAAVSLRVELDAGGQSPGREIRLSGYNVRRIRVLPGPGVTARRRLVLLDAAGPRRFGLRLECMVPAHPDSDDDGLVTFSLADEAFTVSLSAVREQGPVWYPEASVFIASADDPTTFAEYRSRHAGAKTVRQQVAEAPEQSLPGAFHGQPRPHAVAYTLGWKHARQRFWVEPDGDVVLNKRNVTWTPGADSGRFCNEGNARFFFGLGEWIPAGRWTDTPPALAWNLRVKHGPLVREHRCVAVPLRPDTTAEAAGDETVVLLVRIRVWNASAVPARALIPLAYSGNSGRSANRLAAGRSAQGGQDDCLVPRSPREPLTLAPDGRLLGTWQGRPALRAVAVSRMTPETTPDGLAFAEVLAPGASAELVLKIPFITLDREEELAALQALEFDECDRRAREFWSAEARRGARVETPNAHLNALHAMHPVHVSVTDHAVPGQPSLVNTSVGASTYGNFTNESCMIIEELHQRGLLDEARRRIAVWLQYQGTVGLHGRFSDHDGVFYGAGGFEQGQSYCQHHGWVLWIIARHYAVTGDAEWLRSVAPRLIQGMDWVFRQRALTRNPPPPTRGWERGFLPAGGLEDVTDYCYWLSTNALTWRGCDAAAAALEAVGHPDAPRLRRETDAYRQDLVRGFETMRRHAPLVRLRDGRWVPHYPSRLYCRGRDCGWIRETLEGSVYLLLSGLYRPDSPQASWILDDYLDNRYMNPPFGYALELPDRTWFDRGGLSIQPNLLAGLVPHLDRDEIEVFLWMFFNCWAACYREEITAMVEHPYPVLGFSNSAHFKTSDEANAVAWLQAMFAYATPDLLHLGRALPRDWLRPGRGARAAGLHTHFGTVGIAYCPAPGGSAIEARADLDLRSPPRRILVRFRTPGRKPLREVLVNGSPHGAFDPASGDVDVTGARGEVRLRVAF